MYLQTLIILKDGLAGTHSHTNGLHSVVRDFISFADSDALRQFRVLSMTLPLGIRHVFLQKKRDNEGANTVHVGFSYFT